MRDASCFLSVGVAVYIYTVHGVNACDPSPPRPSPLLAPSFYCSGSSAEELGTHAAMYFGTAGLYPALEGLSDEGLELLVSITACRFILAL